MNAETHLALEFPDGKLLIARKENDRDYPRIAIYLHRLNEPDELLCFAEFNSSKPTGGQLCIGAYRQTDDEPSHYESYNKPEEG